MLALEVNNELASASAKDYREEKQGGTEMESVDFFNFRKQRRINDEKDGDRVDRSLKTKHRSKSRWNQERQQLRVLWKGEEGGNKS